jgi:UDP:flavonoid glycosyltransferase YjiC (YdhE family)
MARILVASLPFAGHVGALSAVSAELVRRGHEVVAYTGAKYRKRFVGATWLPWIKATDFDDADLAATFPAIGDGKGMRGGKANADYIIFGTAPGQIADIMAGGPYDLLVTDQIAFGGAVAGQALGIPWVTVAVTPLSMTSRHLPPLGVPWAPPTGPAGRARDAVLRGLFGVVYRRMLDPRLNALRATVGLGPVEPGGLFDSIYSTDLILAQGVPGIEYPRPDLPAHVHFVGRLATAPASAAAPTAAAATTGGDPAAGGPRTSLDSAGQPPSAVDRASDVEPPASGIASASVSGVLPAAPAASGGDLSTASVVVPASGGDLSTASVAVPASGGESSTATINVPASGGGPSIGTASASAGGLTTAVTAPAGSPADAASSAVAGDLPEWWPDLAAATTVVHVTQGTLDMNPDDLLRPTIAGLADRDVLVVVTTGGSDPASLGPLPPNVRAAAFIRHDLLLPEVDVMVSNGGWGGVLAALQAGVPLVVAGDSLDKPEVARRVAWSGAGVDLRTGRPRPSRVAEAVDRVRSDPSFRARARELGAAMTAAGGAARGADLIEQLLTR